MIIFINLQCYNFYFILANNVNTKVPKIIVQYIYIYLLIKNFHMLQ